MSKRAEQAIKQPRANVTWKRETLAVNPRRGQLNTQ